MLIAYLCPLKFQLLYKKKIPVISSIYLTTLIVRNLLQVTFSKAHSFVVAILFQVFFFFFFKFPHYFCTQWHRYVLKFIHTYSVMNEQQYIFGERKSLLIPYSIFYFMCSTKEQMKFMPCISRILSIDKNSCCAQLMQKVKQTYVPS